MILLTSSVISAIGSVLSGFVMGFIIAGLIIVKLVRARLRRSANQNLHDKLPEENRNNIARYIANCERSTETLLRKKLKKKKKWLIVQLFDNIKQKNAERKKKKLLATVPSEPPEQLSEVTEPVPEPVPVDQRIWYPFYLLAHNISSVYTNDEPLAFLELTEKDVFGIIKKVASALETLLDGVGIDYLKKLKISVILETLNIVRTLLSPLQNKTVKNVYSRTLQGYSEIMRFKHAFSINPFYHLRRFVMHKVTSELVIESIKCAIDVVAVEIINIYEEQSGLKK